MRKKKSQKNFAGYILLFVCIAIIIGWQYKASDEKKLTKETKKEAKQSISDDYEDEIIDGDVTLTECPRLRGGNNNYFVSHWANGRVNFSMEYDVTKHCPRWVAFTFDEENSKRNHSGRGQWQWDSHLPSIYDISELYRNSGYDRGHIIASNDRQNSKEANQGTFVMTNVCPQLHSFNAGMWKRLEQKVQSWGRNNRKRDVMYVAKGAILDDDKIEKKRLGGKIAIPKYFWMALVAKKGNEYNGIAFLLEHREYQKGETLRDIAISIDELEKFTSLDLFHNLDDEIEDKVEGQHPDSKESRRYWWS